MFCVRTDAYHTTRCVDVLMSSAASGAGQSSQHAEQQQQCGGGACWVGGGYRQQVDSVRVRDHGSCVLQRRHGGRAGIQVSGGNEVEHAGLVVDVLRRKQCGTVGSGARGGCRRGGGRWAGRVESLGGGASPHTQLQVLLRAERPHDAAWRAQRQAQRAAALTHHQQRANVSGADLCVATGTLSRHLQAVMTSPLAAPHRAVSERRWDVIKLRLVQLLINTLTPVLKDDGDLTGSDIRAHII